MRHLYTYLILGFCFVFASCSDKQYQVLFEQKKLISDTASQTGSTGLANYRIKPQDILQIRNLQNSKAVVDINPGNTSSTQTIGPGTGDTFQVEVDGTVALTGLGHVQVMGLTRFEAQKLIEDLYRKNFLKDPIIEVRITNLKVTVLGEIKTQGEFPLTRDKTTLVELIGEAGGLAETANQTDVRIIRGSQKNPQVTTIDLSDIQSINDPKAVLQNGDIIYISKNKRAVQNEKIQNFSVIFQPIILLINTALIIVSIVRH